MKRVISACFVLTILASSVLAQKTKPWTEWTKKDIDKTLNDSAWGQTHSEGSAASSGQQQTSAITQTTNARREDSNLGAASRVESGEVKASSVVKYHVSFLSAKPVRAAFARLVMLTKIQPDEELTGQLQAFVDRSFADYIVLTVIPRAEDQKMAVSIERMFMGATTDALQKTVYLERKDGKKLFLMDYRAPNGDGMGAKFIFQRTVEGQPFLGENDNVRFFAQLNERVKLNTKYKLSEMLYDGKLEY